MGLWEDNIEVWRSGLLVAVWQRGRWFNVEDDYLASLLNQDRVRVGAGASKEGQLQDTLRIAPLHRHPVSEIVSALRALGYEIRASSTAPSVVLAGPIEAGESLVGVSSDPQDQDQTQSPGVPAELVALLADPEIS